MLRAFLMSFPVESLQGGKDEHPATAHRGDRAREAIALETIRLVLPNDTPPTVQAGKP